MSQDTKLQQLVINKLTTAQYNAALQAGTIDENQLYMTTDSTIVKDITVGGQSAVGNNGTVALGTMATETASNYSTKAVADTLYADKGLETTITTKVDKTNGVSKLYGTDSSGNQTTYNYSDLDNTVNDVTVGGTSVLNNKTAVLGSMAGQNTTNYYTKPDVYNKTEIDGKISAGMHYKGTVANVAALENISSPAVGDLYNVTDTGANYAYDGTNWDKLSENIDLSGYVPTSRTINGKALNTNISLTAADVGALPDSTVIPTVNNATLTIQKNGTTVDTFTANASSNKTINITVPTTVAELSDSSNYITTDDTTETGTVTLATVATTGSYNDLTNKPVEIPSQTGNSGKFLTTNGNAVSWATVDALPSQSGNSGKYLTTNGTSASWSSITIPTVNDATLTITQNGTSVGTFTSNASANKTIDITVPTVDQTYDGTSTNAQSGTAIAGAGFLTNNTSSPYSWVISNTASNQDGLTILGKDTSATKARSTVLGRSAQSTGKSGIVIGYAAYVSADHAIQIGTGTNSTADTLSIGFDNDVTTDRKNWTLLDGTTGLIPDDRLNTTIARTSQIPTTTSQLTNNSGFITGISWGDITGTLSSQSDLNTALNNKANDSSVVHLSGDETINGGKTFNQAFIIGTTETHPNEGGQLIFKKSHNSTMAGDVIVDQNVNNLRVIGQSTSLGIIVPFYIDCENNKVYTATPTTGDNSTQVATTAFVKAQGYATTSQIPTIDQTYNASSSNAQSGTAIASAISSAISSVYKPAGSVVFANLPTPSASNEGNVYNVTNDFTTTSSFVEGAGINYPAGTNVVIIDVGNNTYKFDTLTGAFQPLLVSGTNIKTINSNSILGSGNLDIDALPSQTNNSGKFLTTNGTTASWSNIIIPFGESTSAADAVQKEVTISEITELKTGQIIIVKPTITSTVASSTLKLNNFTAYPMLYGSSAISTSTDSIVWQANYPSWFRFDGSNWIFIGHGAETTYSAMSVAEGTTGTATTARSMRADRLKQIIQGTTLTGLSTSTSSAVTEADTVTTGIGKLQAQIPTTATTSTTGLVKPDGTTITITNDGTISASSSLPSQTGNSGKFLTTNGTTASWATVSIPTIDQTYSSSSTSTNALSHKAIADAKFLQNTATGDGSLAIGVNSSASEVWSVAVGNTAISQGVGVAIGWHAKAGDATSNTSGCVAIGRMAESTGYHSVSIGVEATATADDCISIGPGAHATATRAIQIGVGTNSTPTSLQIGFNTGSFKQYILLDGTTGLIPDARISTNIARTSNIPTVNDSTITIQKNGTTVDSFTTNASSGKTINIEVPTVNDSTITIQKNGTTVDSFTTNASSGKTINIEVPTTATTSTAGLVKPDGTTITITNDGTISASAGSYAMVIVDYTEEE